MSGKPSSKGGSRQPKVTEKKVFDVWIGQEWHYDLTLDTAVKHTNTDGKVHYEWILEPPPKELYHMTWQANATDQKKGIPKKQKKS